MPAIAIETWDLVKRDDRYFLAGPDGLLGPYDSAEDAEDARYVDYDDINSGIKYDDWHSEAPWECCDGWEHEFVRENGWDHPGMCDSAGWVNRPYREGGCGRIEIDDDIIINNWGFTGRSGESKQVYRERIARVKRNAIDQLVKWYENGWSWYVACADYAGYSDSVGGIDCEDYALELAEECKQGVVNQLESVGYVVTGQPEPTIGDEQQSKVERFRERIRRNLNNFA